MCKILAMPFLADERAAIAAWKLAKDCTPGMSKNDDDGCGYVASGPDGLWGERWLANSQAWTNPRKDRIPMDLLTSRLWSPGDPSYNAWGRFQRKRTADALVMHTRWSTCGYGLHNVHPFVNVAGNTALVHNGVVADDFDDYDRCDSEWLLKAYLEEDVRNDPGSIALAMMDQVGSFACVVLGVTDENSRYADVWRNSGSNLNCLIVQDIGVVFATSPHITREACQRLGLAIYKDYPVASETHIRYCLETGTVSFREFPETDTYKAYVSRYTRTDTVCGWPTWDSYSDPAGSTYDPVSAEYTPRQIAAQATVSDSSDWESVDSASAIRDAFARSDTVPDADPPDYSLPVAMQLADGGYTDAGQLIVDEIREAIADLEDKDQPAECDPGVCTDWE